MTYPSVLVFSGLDPSGGAGIQADIQAISAAGVHTLPIITALTVQDNEHVFAVHPVDPDLIRAQAKALVDAGTAIDAVKIGIVGSAANAQAIAEVISDLRQRQADLPVVLDPVLASGHGDTLTRGDAIDALEPLRRLATVITLNLPEAAALCPQADGDDERAQALLNDVPHVLLKGGHGDSEAVINRWYSAEGRRDWQWPRLPGAFHGSGCTLASAVAGRIAQSKAMYEAIDESQRWTQQALATAYAIAAGQAIPNRL
jgi:hydroxymethylpyrimidine/phosphomethylpyrimidine kinase